MTERRKSKNPAAVPPGVANAAAGKTYVLFEGTILETVLINRSKASFLARRVPALNRRLLQRPPAPFDPRRIEAAR